MPGEPERLDALRIDREDRGEEGDRRPRRALWLVVLLLAAGAGAVAWWLARPRAAAVEVVAVREVTGSGGGPAAVLDASGYVTARRQATVSSKVTGKIVEVAVEEGMAVAEGQVLARLDDAAARKELALAGAQVEAARAALEETRVRLAEARLELGRTEKLTDSGVTTPADLDAARAAAAALAAQLELGRHQVEVAERQLAVARQAVEDTVIRAPFAGVAISKDAQPGEMISPVSAGGGFTRTGICTLVDMGSLEIEVDVNESYIHRVRAGQRVEAVLDAYPDWRIPGRVIAIVPAADRQKATVKVRVGFDELDPRILPDMGVKVSFLAPEGEGESGAGREAVLLVPQAAVRREEDGTRVVFVVRDGRAERRAVRVGVERDGEAQVLSGLAAGERVVAGGPADLADGERVEESER